MIYLSGHKLIDDSDWANSNIGTNLIEHSDSWSGSMYSLGSAQLMDQKYQNGKILQLSNIGTNNAIYIKDLPTNSLLSWSIFARSDNASMHTEIIGGINQTDVNVSSSWTRYSFTARTDSSGIIFFWNNGEQPLYLALPKIELGSIATQWSPALADLVTQSDLDDLKAQIEQLKSK